jgi:hypothetical protein
MDARLVWISLLFIEAVLLSFLYFMFEQERKKNTDARRQEREGED